MKKILLATAFLGLTFASAQMSVQKLDGTPFVNGAVYTYNTYDTDSSILHFTVANTSATQSIKVKVLCEALVNTEGDDFEFCYGGNCMPFVILGQEYPPTGFVIGPNSNSGDSDHFWNKIDSDVPMSYTFKFFMVDPLGEPVGEPVRITYKYDKTMAVTESSVKAGIQLKSNIVTDHLEINSLKNAKITLFDMNGKQILQQDIKAGSQTINVHALTSGIYILNAVNAEGKTGNFKIIKK